MTCPAPDATLPFTTAPVPLTDITGSNSPDTIPFSSLSSIIRQAFAAQRASSSFARGKVHKTEGGDVQIYKGGSGQKGKFAKCAWHGRYSVHEPAKTFGLSYDDFRRGLLIDHGTQEALYIHECVHSKMIKSLRKGTAEVWQNSYHLPAISSNRDFCELLVTLDLPAHVEPFSEAHEAEVLSAYSSEAATIADVAPPASAKGEGKKRSFVVIQVPVTTELCPDRTKEGYVRASYASVEAVVENEDGSVEWNMFVQSNAAGRVPHMFQEMAMPNKIHPDVPSFILWARDNLEAFHNKRGGATEGLQQEDNVVEAQA